MYRTNRMSVILVGKNTFPTLFLMRQCAAAIFADKRAKKANYIFREAVPLPRHKFNRVNSDKSYKNENTPTCIARIE